jgi:hypothetical protein
MTARIDRKSHPVGALFYSVAERGLGVLKEPVNAGRYERLDPEARAEVDGKIREIVNDRVPRMKQAEKQQRPARQGKAAR